VAADLRRRIAAGEWGADEALPTTAALAEHYHVSQSTVTRVLRILADEGLVRTVPRWGTFRAG
jgi:GntR family transcriptional regulator